MYKATLRNGTIMDFNGQCNRIDYTSNANVMIFRNYVQSTKKTYTLAIIPYDMISVVTAEKDEIKPKK